MRALEWSCPNTLRGRKKDQNATARHVSHQLIFIEFFGFLNKTKKPRRREDALVK